MNRKEITINGKSYKVAFTFQTILNFEDVTGKSFFAASLDTLKNRIALIFAAVLAADENTDITVESITGKQDLSALNDIIAAHNVIMEMSGGFFKIPEVEKVENKEGDDEVN